MFCSNVFYGEPKTSLGWTVSDPCVTFSTEFDNSIYQTSDLTGFGDENVSTFILLADPKVPVAGPFWELASFLNKFVEIN